MKSKVVVDSTFYLSQEEIKKYDIKVASLNVIDGTETHRELDLENQFIYDSLANGKHLTTSQPSPAEFLHLYQQCLDQGAERIYVLTLSEPLSGTYQSALLAQKMLENPDVVYLFKSQMAAVGNELLTMRLVEMIEQGKSDKDIVQRIEALNKKANINFTIENLIHLMRSGRLSRAKALIGTVLRVKPLLHMIEGRLEIAGSARTHKKILDTIIENMQRTTEGAKKIYVRVVSKSSLENARALEQLIKDTFKNAEISFSEYMGPVFSLHLGTNAYGLSWTSE